VARADPADARVVELAGRTVGLIGRVTSARRSRRRIVACDARVQYFDIAASRDAADALGVRFVLLDELLRTSDVVSLHVPSTTALGA
jgi:phosphoglycerate dehydrogenase-like enzyme